MKARSRHWLIGGTVVITALLICFAVLNLEGIERDRSRAIARSILERLHTGMTREEVEQVLGAHVEWRYHCNLANGSEEVCLIGSRNPNLASMLYLVYEIIDGKETLIRIGGIDISMLPEFEACTSSAK